jgi:hypothetical protein
MDILFRASIFFRCVVFNFIIIYVHFGERKHLKKSMTASLGISGDEPGC